MGQVESILSFVTHISLFASTSLTVDVDSKWERLGRNREPSRPNLYSPCSIRSIFRGKQTAGRLQLPVIYCTNLAFLLEGKSFFSGETFIEPVYKSIHGGRAFHKNHACTNHSHNDNCLCFHRGIFAWGITRKHKQVCMVPSRLWVGKR